ncbi:MAG: hypothetical protein LBD93_00890 [Treponema sp.]|jgi:hypothetical protein|nr:hypothetical protein [Treponema sp.]
MLGCLAERNIEDKGHIRMKGADKGPEVFGDLAAPGPFLMDGDEVMDDFFLNFLSYAMP